MTVTPLSIDHHQLYSRADCLLIMKSSVLTNSLFIIFILNIRVERAHQAANLCPMGFSPYYNLTNIAALWFEQPKKTSYASYEQYINGWSIFDGEEFFQIKLVGSYITFSHTLIVLPRKEPTFWQSFKTQLDLSDTMANQYLFTLDLDNVYLTRMTKTGPLTWFFSREKGQKLTPRWRLETKTSPEDIENHSKWSFIVTKTKPWEPAVVQPRYLSPEEYRQHNREFADFTIPYEHRILHGNYSWIFFKEDGKFRLIIYKNFSSFFYDPDDTNFKLMPICYLAPTKSP